MALAPRTVQCIPARFSRVPMATLQPASTTPEEVHSPWTSSSPLGTCGNASGERCGGRGRGWKRSFEFPILLRQDHEYFPDIDPLVSPADKGERGGDALSLLQLYPR